MTEDSDSVDSIWIGDIIGVERVKPIDERGLRTRRIRKLPGATHSPITPMPTAKPDEPVQIAPAASALLAGASNRNPRTSHCHVIRLTNREEDLINAGLTAEEATL